MGKETGSEILATRRLEDYLVAHPTARTAYEFAQKVHEGQVRVDGTSHFDHCVAVARIIYEEWRLDDEEIIAAAFLHDTHEDKKVALSELSGHFGERVAFLVGGVSKFSLGDRKVSDEKTLKKVVELGYIDYHISLLKLADRLHNMRTMGEMPFKKAVAKSKETINVYAKLAQSLGMWEVRRELQDRAFFYVDPEGYREVEDELARDGRLDDKFIAHTKSLLTEIIARHGGGARVKTQVNSLLRLKEKEGKVGNFKKINDVVSFRIIVEEKETQAETIFECYRLFGILRNNPRFNALEDMDRFDDFIASPRENGYRAIQMTLDDPARGTFEFAIAGEAQEEFNRWGILSRIRRGERELGEYILKLVFTPKGEIRFLHQDATAVDYAASINDPTLLAQAVAVDINGERFPLSTVLPNGVDVEIVRDEERIAPDPDFLNYCLPETRKKVLTLLDAEALEELKRQGEERVRELLTPRGLLDIEDIKDEVKSLLLFLDCEGKPEKLYFKVGTGALSLKTLGSELDKIGVTKEKMGLTTIFIEGEDKPNILRDVSTWVSDFGGNIKASKHRGTKKRFSLRFVVEGLSASSEAELAQKLKEDGRFEKSLVV